MFNANSVRLRACRRRGGLDQAELAQLIGTSYSTVSRFERGQSLPDLQSLIAYELVFDIPVSKLLPDTTIAVRNLTRERAAKVLKRCRRTTPPNRAGKLDFLECACRRLDGIES